MELWSAAESCLIMFEQRVTEAGKQGDKTPEGVRERAKTGRQFNSVGLSAGCRCLIPPSTFTRLLGNDP